MKTAAPQSRSWVPFSGAARARFTPTHTAPSNCVAKNATMISLLFGAEAATTVPAPTPSDRKAAAAAWA